MKNVKLKKVDDRRGHSTLCGVLEFIKKNFIQMLFL